VEEAVGKARERHRMSYQAHDCQVGEGRAGVMNVDVRYSMIKKLGQGAYGIVGQFTDTTNGSIVAIKKTTKAFDDPTDAKRTLRELKLLSHLEHENIVRLTDVLPSAATADGQQDVYMVMESMDTDLHQIIRSKQELTDEHAQYFMYQLFCGLKFMHSAGVLHRDLKPGNLLVNRNCDLKICDFGLARIASGVGGEADKGDVMTEYVITRWYRPPELILTRNYDTSIDMWSAGCILGELLLRKPIFPGRDYVDQIKIIIQQIGSPSEADKAFITNKKVCTRSSGLSIGEHGEGSGGRGGGGARASLVLGSSCACVCA
jgi:serine/threonine protein kinase